MKDLMKKCAVECIGTFALVFFAVGAACLSGNVLTIALAFGLVVALMAYTIGGVSGCHLNPAVSVAMYAMKKIDLKTFIGYIIAQFVGAILGALVLYSIMQMPFDFAIRSFGVNLLIGGKYSFGAVVASLLLELILTFIFVYVIIYATNSESIGNKAGLFIAATLVLVHIVGIGLTGTSVNPARSFGPALISLFFKGGADAIAQVWVFILAPMGGGVLAAFVYKLIHDKVSDEDMDAYVKEQKDKEKENKKKKEEKDKIKAEKKLEKENAKQAAKAAKAAESENDEYEEDDDDDEYEDDDDEYEDDGENEENE